MLCLSIQTIDNEVCYARTQVPLEEVQRAVAMADAALKAKTRSAERRALQAASLAYQKGSALAGARAEQHLSALRGRVAALEARATPQPSLTSLLHAARLRPADQPA